MTEREIIATKVAEIRQHAQYCNEECCDGQVADFIIADRKAVLERVRRPLADVKHEDQTRTDGWVTDYQLWQAVDKALEEIDRAMDKPRE